MDTNKIEELFNEYLETPIQGAELEELRRTSYQLEAEAVAGTVTNESLAQYEYAAAKAGFYAGFMAAMSN